MSSAVEWTQQILTMYEGGGRLFMEDGPKRALALFAEQILDETQLSSVAEGVVVTNTNHPKVGGIASFLSSLAVCSLAGRLSEMHPHDSLRLTEGFRAGPIEIWGQKNIGLPKEAGVSRSEWE